MSVGGQIGEWLTGAYAAIGTMVSLARAARDGPGELVDVSMLETLALCLTYYPVTYADMVGPAVPQAGGPSSRPGWRRRATASSGVGVGTGQQWLDFCVMVGHPEWMEDRKLFANRGHLRPDIAAWMAEHTTAEVLELAGAFRIPHAPIGNGATIPATDHFAGPRLDRRRTRATASTSPTGPTGSTRPSSASPAPAPRLGEHDADATPGERATHRRGRGRGVGRRCRSQGLRVLDLTAFWAGPLCTHVLAMLGAEVLHIESTARPDGTRLLAGLRFSEPDWWEQSGIFSGLNTNKKSVTLDLATDRGRDAAAPADRDLRRPRRELHAPRCWSSSGSTSTPSAPSGPTSSWSGCPASASTARGATTRPSPSSSRTPPG